VPASSINVEDNHSGRATRPCAFESSRAACAAPTCPRATLSRLLAKSPSPVGRACHSRTVQGFETAKTTGKTRSATVGKLTSRRTRSANGPAGHGPVTVIMPSFGTTPALIRKEARRWGANWISTTSRHARLARISCPSGKLSSDSRSVGPFCARGAAANPSLMSTGSSCVRTLRIRASLCSFTFKARCLLSETMTFRYAPNPYSVFIQACHHPLGDVAAALVAGGYGFGLDCRDGERGGCCDDRVGAGEVGVGS